MTPISDVAVALPVVVGGILTVATVTAGVVMWLAGQFRDLRDRIDGVDRRLLHLEWRNGESPAE